MPNKSGIPIQSDKAAKPDKNIQPGSASAPGMLRKHRNLLYYVDRITDAAVIVLSYMISMYIRYYIMDSFPGLPVLTPPYLLIVAVYGVIMAFIFSYGQSDQRGWQADKTGLYEKSGGSGFYNLLSVNVIGCLVLMSFFYVVGIVYFSRWALILFWGISSILIVVKKLFVINWMSKDAVRSQCGVNTLVIGDGSLAKEYIHSAYAYASLGRNIVGYVKVHEDSKLEDSFSNISWDNEENPQKSSCLTCLGKVSDGKGLKGLIEENDIDEVILALEDMETGMAEKIPSALEGKNVSVGMVAPYAGLIPAEAAVYGFGDTKVIETKKKRNEKGRKTNQMGMLLSVSALLIMLILNLFSVSFGLGDFRQLDAYEAYKCIVFAVLAVFIFSYLTFYFQNGTWANTKRVILSAAICFVLAAVYEPVYTGGVGSIECIIMDMKAVGVSAVICWCVSGLVRQISRDFPMNI